MQTVHLAVAETGLVIAHFMGEADAAKFCKDNDLCLVYYDLFNRANPPAPPVGTIYKA